MTDAHCHPFDLLEYMPDAEEARRKSKVACVANSWNREQFEYHESLSSPSPRSPVPDPQSPIPSPRSPIPDPQPLIPSFGIHPQLPADAALFAKLKDELLGLLENLPAENRLGAVGETGFDLYGEKNRETEKVQDELFVLHLETAVKHGLPLVIHSRRAMHKIFPFAKTLKKLPAVVFHSWPGTLGEGEAILRRGINVFFSFGAAVINKHREAMRCSALFPASRLLIETDAPYQPPRGRAFSSWKDLEFTCRTIAALRKEAENADNTAETVEKTTDANFSNVFGSST